MAAKCTWCPMHGACMAATWSTMHGACTAATCCSPKHVTRGHGSREAWSASTFCLSHLLSKHLKSFNESDHIYKFCHQSINIDNANLLKRAQARLILVSYNLVWKSLMILNTSYIPLRVLNASYIPLRVLNTSYIPLRVLNTSYIPLRVLKVTSFSGSKSLSLVSLFSLSLSLKQQERKKEHSAKMAENSVPVNNVKWQLFLSMSIIVSCDSISFSIILLTTPQVWNI